MDQIWSYVLTVVGLLGFMLAGKKVWWAWYINIANQFIWTAYAVITEQWGFIIGSVFYFVVFGRNAYLWTREHLGYIKEPFCNECNGPYTQRQ